VSEKRFKIEERVRWSDVDHARLIFYGSYLRFFEIAETELLRDVGLPYGEIFERFDIWLPRVQIHCDFLAPAVLDDWLEVETYVGRVGEKSLTLNFEVFKKEGRILVAKAHIIMVCVRRGNLKSVRLPDELVERLAPYVARWERKSRSQDGEPPG
jgi:YbgC/YbaW family acyl-CoA thioester hydrolase